MLAEVTVTLPLSPIFPEPKYGGLAKVGVAFKYNF